ncbi:MAG: NAD-dependent epimerase/dehydratase family protein [Deltaproteobacteria bacterium]|nr:NAD-dependent epimerase/dehydratase family protein [Deltaproteobacteria bacterium]MBW2445496.1 NAD-dependent epimerase/dehydratase family protein [Deltaproteobacteria bacterium]
MKALVLGGSQFVGLHTVQELVARGWDVTVLNRGKTEARLPPGVERLVADRTDAESMRSALAGTEWDAVVDVSGFVMVTQGAGMSDLVELLDGRVGAYVFTSSVMAYAPSGSFPWDETFASVDEGPNTYGGFKKAAEQTLLERHATTGFPASVVRPAAIYGPDNNIYDMEMAYFLRLLRGLPVILPHDGLVATSYGHVDDLCRTMVDMATHPAAPGEVYNVTAEGVTANEYVARIAEIVGKPADVIHMPSAWIGRTSKPAYNHLFGAAHHGILSIEKARSRLGFEPEYDFRAGHAQTFEWFTESGLHETKDAPMDPLWFASFDFDYEARLAEAIRAGSPDPV